MSGKPGVLGPEARAMLAGVVNIGVAFPARAEDHAEVVEFAKEMGIPAPPFPRPQATEMECANCDMPLSVGPNVLRYAEVVICWRCGLAFRDSGAQVEVRSAEEFAAAERAAEGRTGQRDNTGDSDAGDDQAAGGGDSPVSRRTH